MRPYPQFTTCASEPSLRVIQQKRKQRDGLIAAVIGPILALFPIDVGENSGHKKYCDIDPQRAATGGTLDRMNRGAVNEPPDWTAHLMASIIR